MSVASPGGSLGTDWSKLKQTFSRCNLYLSIYIHVCQKFVRKLRCIKDSLQSTHYALLRSIMEWNKTCTKTKTNKDVLLGCFSNAGYSLQKAWSFGMQLQCVSRFCVLGLISQGREKREVTNSQCLLPPIRVSSTVFVQCTSVRQGGRKKPSQNTKFC